MTSPALALLTVTGLRKEFRIRVRGAAKKLTAVDGVDLTVNAGETVALVGESGSGKSTVARCIVRLIEPTSGEVMLDGRSVTALSRREIPTAYGELQMMFQDPHSSLNPRMPVRKILDEPLRLHTDYDRRRREEMIMDLLRLVNLGPEYLDRLPRQLSGGQRQRIGMARALAVDPKVIILDEPTASLDVSVRGQILDLLSRIQQEKQVGYLFISHDLATVRKIADQVLVMYLGKIVERGPTREVFSRPRHPYTRALLSAAPVAEHGRVKERLVLHGEIPSPIDLPTGCRLAGRCPFALASCRDSVPELIPVTDRHSVACPVVLSDPVAAGEGAVAAAMKAVDGPEC
jgi:oligopeptide/dipeptide ABC transporter ATP-binding protein